MKHLKLTLIIFSLIAISALHSCKPEPPDPQPTDLGFFGLGEAKDYVYFKKGTWWVYQNTRTGQLDTIVVYNSILDTSERISKKWKYIDEVFAVDSRSISTAHYYHLYERYGPVDVINRPRNLIIPNFERREPFEGDINPFYYPFNDPIANYCITVKDTMNIMGKIYSKVAVFYIQSDDSEPIPLKNKPAKYYWAKNYGLVQKDLFDSKFIGDTSLVYHSWKLSYSNIIQ